jgi:hypothetical protein
MKRSVLFVLLAATMAFAGPARADIFLLGFNGFDYEDPDGSADYLGIGDGYKALGFITSVGPMLAPYYDDDVYEYTFYLFGLTVATRDFDVPTQTLFVTFNDNARARYYRDPHTGGTDAVFGINPPNATAPSTFIDGELVLGGDTDGFTVFYDFMSNSGSTSGEMTQDEGTYFDNGYVDPVGGWTLSGLLGRPNPTVPTGYDNQVQGECVIRVVPSTQRTWGAIKRTYR